MSDINELDVTDVLEETGHDEQYLGCGRLASAIEAAAAETSDAEDGKMTWLLKGGQRIAAIIPATTAAEIEYQFMDEPPHNEYHYRNHTPATPDPDCANCKFIGWLR